MVRYILLRKTLTMIWVDSRLNNVSSTPFILSDCPSIRNFVATQDKLGSKGPLMVSVFCETKIVSKQAIVSKDHYDRS